MQLREASRGLRSLRSIDTLGKVPEIELVPDLNRVRELLLSSKEWSGQVLDNQVGLKDEIYCQKDQRNSDFLRHCQAIMALRVLFPEQPELGVMIESRRPEDLPLRGGHIEEISWEYLVLLHSIDWRKMVAETSVGVPTAVEFLHEFSKQREQKQWLPMVRLGLVASQIYPAVANQVKVCLRESWSTMMQSTWGGKWNNPNQLSPETVALGVLIDPALRELVDTNALSYKERKSIAIKEHDGGDLAWFKIIEAEVAEFNEKHELVIKSPEKQRQNFNSSLPDRLVG